MTWEVIDDGGNNKHLPDFASKPESGMLGSGLRHLAIVEDGEVIATVWNHHDATRCVEAAHLMAAAPAMLSMLEELAQMAEDDAALFDERKSAWRPFYLVHRDKILAVIAKVRKPEKAAPKKKKRAKPSFCLSEYDTCCYICRRIGSCIALGER